MTARRWVVHVKRAAYDVYVGRPSPFGNPFVIGRDGDRAAMILRYRAWLLVQPVLVERVRRELAGKMLGLLVRALPCHGDVLAEIGAGTHWNRPRSPDPPTSPRESLHESCRDDHARVPRPGRPPRGGPRLSSRLPRGNGHLLRRDVRGRHGAPAARVALPGRHRCRGAPPLRPLRGTLGGPGAAPSPVRPTRRRPRRASRTPAATSSHARPRRTARSVSR